MLRKIPGTGKYVFFQNSKTRPSAWFLRLSQDQWHFKLAFASEGWEKGPQSSCFWQLIQEDWCVCGHLSVVVTLLHSGGGSRHAFVAKDECKGRALSVLWGPCPFPHRWNNPAHSAGSWVCLRHCEGSPTPRQCWIEDAPMGS